MAIDKHSSTAAQIGLAVLFVALVLGIGYLSGTAGDGANSEWFQNLEKPAFNPPSWVFGPVWTVLYILMGLAAFLVWREGPGRREVQVALGLFALQFLLNAAWSPAFFGAQSVAGAAVIIVVLIVVLALTVWRFFRVRRLAGWLLVPYLLWTAFATALNLSILALN
jgi:translocator protein